jgi:ribosomal protein S30
MGSLTKSGRITSRPPVAPKKRQFPSNLLKKKALQELRIRALFARTDFSLKPAKIAQKRLRHNMPNISNIRHFHLRNLLQIASSPFL